MIDDLSIRLVKEEDLDDLAKLYLKVYTHFDVREKWDFDSAYKLVSYWFKRQPDLCFLSELKGKIVGGFVAGIKPWCDGNHLVDGEMFVDPDYQKKGIGSELSKVMYRTALEKYDAKIFDAITFSKKEHPLKWYKRQGFREVKEWTIISGDLREILENLDKQKHL